MMLFNTGHLFSNFHNKSTIIKYIKMKLMIKLLNLSSSNKIQSALLTMAQQNEN